MMRCNQIIIQIILSVSFILFFHQESIAKIHDYHQIFDASFKVGSSLPIGEFRNHGADDTYHLGIDGGYWIKKDLRLSIEFAQNFNFFDSANTSLGITQGMGSLEYNIITYKALYTFMIGAGAFTSRMKMQSLDEPLITSTDPGLMTGTQIRFPDILSSFDLAFYTRLYLIPDESYHRLFLNFGISAIHRFGES